MARLTLHVRGLLGQAEPILIAGGRAADHSTEFFTGIDVAKTRNAFAIADGERGGEIRYLGEVDGSEESLRPLVKRIIAQHGPVHFCYEAGPTGYGHWRPCRIAPSTARCRSDRGGDVAAEIDDRRRFDNPRQLMSYLGLVPSERSSGDTIPRVGLTNAGNGRVRHMLVESAWTYRHPPRIGKAKLYRLHAAPTKVREIAWKAQTRLTARYRTLTKRGKKTTVVCAGMAREVVGFTWAVAREVQPA